MRAGAGRSGRPRGARGARLPGGRHLFAAATGAVHPVPVDGDGLLVAPMPPTVRLAYVTPSHQFPTGVSMSLARRLELLDWARAPRRGSSRTTTTASSATAVPPLPSLQGLDDAPRVVYVGTFSKVMFPALRLGYLVLPAAAGRAVRAARKRSPTRPHRALEQAALADFIREGHLERHLRRMRRVYKRRREALVDVDDPPARRSGGDRRRRRRPPRGGALTGRGVVARARQVGVALESTEGCYAGTAPANEVLVRFAGVPERMLREGIRRIAALRP